MQVTTQRPSFLRLYQTLPLSLSYFSVHVEENYSRLRTVALSTFFFSPHSHIMKLGIAAPFDR